MTRSPQRKWKAGDIVENEYPFVRTTYQEFDEDGFCDVPSWKPGCDYELCSPYGDEADAVADGVGKQILTVIDVHKPGRFPCRVFYTCKWITPDGKPFGKGNLKITTVAAFNRRAAGFMSDADDFEWRIRNAEPTQ